MPTDEPKPFREWLAAFQARHGRAVDAALEKALEKLHAELLANTPDLSAVYHTTRNGTNLGADPMADRPAPPPPFVKPAMDEVVAQMRAELRRRRK